MGHLNDLLKQKEEFNENLQAYQSTRDRLGIDKPRTKPDYTPVNVLVMGNGFDIAHGLPTKYNDFLEYCEANIDEDIVKNNIISNIWYMYFLKLRENDISIKENWIDFESEISLMIQFLDSATQDLHERFQVIYDKKAYEHNKAYHTLLDNKKTVFLNLCIEKKYKIQTFEYVRNDMLRDLEKFTFTFEQYLYKILTTSEVNKIKQISELKVDLLLSFNYTNTYEKVYDYKPTFYVHGQCKKHTIAEDSVLVLGIDDYVTYDGQKNTTNYLVFKKFMQRITKGTLTQYKEAMDKAVEITEIKEETHYQESGQYMISDVRAFDIEEWKKKNIYFYGHSLDVTDIDILEDIFQVREMNIDKFSDSDLDYIKIFCMDKADKVDKISNIVKIISPYQLTKRMNDGTIEFIETEKVTVLGGK